MKNFIAPLTIGNIKIVPNIAIAPMAGYTDLAYRRIVREIGGAGILYTELVSCHALIHCGKKTLALVATTPDEHPLGMQIFGSDPAIMAASASILEDLGADFIDINMGCPVSKVVKTGGGAVLMTDPEAASNIVASCIKAVSIPITVKIRAGWDDSSRNAPEFAKCMAGAGAAVIAVHGRTRAQGYAGKADRSIIKQVVESVNVPVIANGDIVDGNSAIDMFERTGCAGIMIGRAAMGAPWIYKKIYEFLESGKNIPDPSSAERGALAWKHFNYLKELYGEYIACLHIRRISCSYSRGLPGVKEFRRKAVRVESSEQVYEVLNEYFKFDV
ncbi:tRNA dihydrouridine synthase DusB [bacterium]|nr:tRNA dihydrouridine synthase DusB [bacterium]